MMMLKIPEELIPPCEEYDRDDFTEECIKLRSELIAEFTTMKYLHRKHGAHKTYVDGCAGPACKQAHRTYYRNKDNREATAYWVIFDPIVTLLALQIKEQVEDSLAQARDSALRTLAEDVDSNRRTVITDV